MAHCNTRPCSRSTRFDGDERVCDCPCDICTVPAGGAEARRKAQRSPVCDACGAELGEENAFCDGCGASVGASARPAAEPPAGPAKAPDSTLVIAGLALLFGYAAGHRYFAARKTADRALERLASYASDAVITFDGKQHVVGTLRSAIGREPTSASLAHFILASTMAGLFVWSRRSPAPAMATALAVYVVFQALRWMNGAPPTFYLDVLVVLALGAGLKSALASRRSKGAST